MFWPTCPVTSQYHLNIQNVWAVQFRWSMCRYIEICQGHILWSFAKKLRWCSSLPFLWTVPHHFLLYLDIHHSPQLSREQQNLALTWRRPPSVPSQLPLPHPHLLWTQSSHHYPQRHFHLKYNLVPTSPFFLEHSSPSFSWLTFTLSPSHVPLERLVDRIPSKLNNTVLWNSCYIKQIRIRRW